MAVTIPRTLLGVDCKSKAERKLFDALRDGLSDEWTVYHSASLVVRDHAEGATDDECDLVLCHAEEGVVALEVKGGGLECRHGEWRRGSGADRERIRDPFAQAIDHKHNLRRKLEQARGAKRPELHVVHALALPDLTVHQLALAPDAPREILWDRHDVADVESALRRTLDYHRGSRDKRVAPDPELVRRTLAPDVHLEVPLGVEFLDEEEEMVLLTHEQAGLVARHWREQRMAVHGCAGSGKTMIAVDRAKKLARRGDDVLFVCFNRQLAEHLKREHRHDRIRYATFHGLCTWLASRAGVEIPQYPREDTPATFWSIELPAALLEACERLGGQFDHLIVDEAQDLRTEWLEALTDTLRDPERGSIWLFLDDNQRVYDADLQIPSEFRPYDLTVNCRNTQAIHREVMKYYDGDIEFDVMGPEGREPVRHAGPDLTAAVATAVAVLVDKGEIPPQDIAVLSPHALENSQVAQAGCGRFTFTKERGRLGDHVQFSSIRSFKGLEAKAVVLCELEDLDPQTRDQQMYVAISRARHHCVILERAA